ncbi:MAG: cation transporter [Phycisphaeraceae bacterium]|nr:cation transporter [Phycisphaeraceae bacterium]MCB9847256.1 cation transporter [Phycisphaeraceae bacterium]
MKGTRANAESGVSSEGAALTGLVTNVSLAAVKLVTGIVGNSFALVADAVESMVDIAGSLIVWSALRYGAKPADEDHPFGHGKAESLAGMAVGLLIIVAGVGIAARSVDGIVQPQESPAWYTLVVLALVITIKEALYRLTKRAADASASSAGFADAWHHRSDAITSLAAMIGISVSLIGGERYAPADDWAALIASFVIMVNGVLLMRAPCSELMDEASPELAARCSEIVLSVEGIRRIERCEARKVGRTHRVIMHAEVDPEMTVERAHALTGKAKALVREQLPQVASLLIHIEPHG